MSMEITAKLNTRPAPPPAARADALTQETLDSLPVLELQYYEAEFTRPLVTAIVAQVQQAVSPGGRVLAAGVSPLLAHALLKLDYQLDIYAIGGQTLPAELQARVKGALAPADLQAPTLPFAAGQYDAAILPMLLETIPGDPVPFLYRLRHFLRPDGAVILAGTNLRKLGTRWRALAGRELQPSWLHEPQEIPGEWPVLQPCRFYSPPEIGLLARCAGYGLGPVNYFTGRRPFKTLDAVSLPGWLAGKVRYAVGNALPGWREHYALTLRALPHFDLPGYRAEASPNGTVPRIPGEAGAPYWQPFVSVVLPTHNRAAMLRDALENGLFLQNYPPHRWEIILINDGSTDDTEATAQELASQSPVPVRYFKLDGRGAAAARNFGVQQTKGEVIAHLDDDARPVSDWLEAGVNSFKPGVALVAGPIVPDPRDRWGFFSYVPMMLHDRGLFPTHNLFIRAGLARAHHGFDESFGKNMLGRPVPGWDTDLAYRILRQGYSHVFAPAALTYSRIFPLGWRGWFKETVKWQFQAGIIKRIPESRRGLAPIGGLIAEGPERLFWLLSLLGLILSPWLGPWSLLATLPWLGWAFKLFAGKELPHPVRTLKGMVKMGLMWVWYLGAFIFLLYGAVKARRLLL